MSKPPPPPRAPIDERTLERLLSLAMARGADFAEVYAERTERTSASLEDSKIRSATFGVDQGVGIRAISGAKVGYAYSDSCSSPPRSTTPPGPRSMTPPSDASQTGAPLKAINSPVFYRVPESLSTLAVQPKIDLLLRGDAAARTFMTPAWRRSSVPISTRPRPSPWAIPRAISPTTSRTSAGCTFRWWPSGRMASAEPASTAAAAGSV